MFVVVAVLLFGIRTAMQANKQARPSTQETPYVPVEPAVEA
jgi:carbon starvation protein